MVQCLGSICAIESNTQLCTFDHTLSTLCAYSGAHGVGRRHIKNTLISTYPKRYAYPIPRMFI